MNKRMKITYFRHRPLRSFCYAVGIFMLFFIGTPMMVMQAESIPVFNNWRDQPLPSGNPIRVQYFLDGTLYDETIDLLVFKVQQFEKVAPIDL